MRRKGFTLVELLVVIAIIALLMSILMPALAQVRRLAQRIICGTHLSAIGKAMLVYAQDNEQDLPRAGGKLSIWSTTGKIKKWDAEGDGTNTAQKNAFGTATSGNPATISSCLFLLIKYADGIPKIFNCAGDLDSRIFDLSESENTTLTNIKDAWDFGNGNTSDGLLWPGQYESYSYHMPFSYNSGAKCYALESSDSAASPVCADRNPYLDKNARIYIDRKNPDDEYVKWDSKVGYIDQDKVRNAAAHQREGQNVLYVDAHVEFEKTPNCGIQNDLIWINWDPSIAYGDMTAKQRQFRQADCSTLLTPKLISTINTSGGPQNIEDAYLINEYNADIATFK
jgi:prepilin-type N-terminal cleavage/methylation domain-containing protein